MSVTRGADLERRLRAIACWSLLLCHLDHISTACSSCPSFSRTAIRERYADVARWLSIILEYHPSALTHHPLHLIQQRLALSSQLPLPILPSRPRLRHLLPELLSFRDLDLALPLPFFAF